MARCCVDLAKFLLFITNFICFLAFAALLAAAIYVVSEGNFLGVTIDPSLSPTNPTVTHFTFIIIFIVIFSFFTLITFLGCCGTATRSACMITTFIVIQFVLFGLSVAGVVYLHTQYGQEGVSVVLVQELSRTIAGYSTDNILTHRFWDWVQPTLACCGVTSWEIWTSTAVLPSSWQVPPACCRPDFDTCAVTLATTATITGCCQKPTEENAYLGDGCVEKVLLYVQIFVYGVPSLILLSLLLAFVVSSQSGASSPQAGPPAASRRNRVKDREESEDYSTGYDDEQASYPSAPHPDNAPYNPHYGHQMRVAFPESGYRGDPYLYPTGVAPPPDQDPYRGYHPPPPTYNSALQ